METSNVLPELIARVLNGDEPARVELMGLLNSQKHRFIPGLIGRGVRSADLDDALQEGLLRIFTHLHHFDPNREWWPWCSSVISNRAIDLYRRNERHDHAPLGDWDGSRGDGRDDPARLAEFNDGLVAFERLIAEEDEVTREILRLRIQEDLPPREIALKLGSSVGIVSGRYHAALRRLREALRDLDPQSPQGRDNP